MTDTTHRVPERRMEDERLDALLGAVSQNSPRIDNIEKSISRMESSLAELSKAMISLARVEERLAGSHDRIEQLHNEVAILKKQYDSVITAAAARDNRAGIAGEKMAWIERAAWVVFAAGASYAVSVSL